MPDLTPVLKRMPDETILRAAASSYSEWMEAPMGSERVAEETYLLLLDEVLRRKIGSELLALTRGAR